MTKPVHDIGQAEVPLTKFKNILMELWGSPEMPTDAFILFILRFLFDSNHRLTPTLAACDLMPDIGTHHLMENIERICVEHRAAAATRPPKVKAAAGLSKTPNT
eukprot:6261995-Pyramimonas_sp.AAC.1